MRPTYSDQRPRSRFPRERLGYKAKEGVVFLDRRPLNATAKVDRANLQQMAQARLGDEKAV
jgi:hypothetical protein